MSSMILSAVLSAIGFVIIQAGTCIVFFKPDRLRFAEVPVWLLAVLAGPEARGRLRRIMDSRERARRDRETLIAEFLRKQREQRPSIVYAGGAVTVARGCADDHEALLTSPHGMVMVSVNGTILEIPLPGDDQT